MFKIILIVGGIFRGKINAKLNSLQEYRINIKVSRNIIKIIQRECQWSNKFITINYRYSNKENLKLVEIRKTYL